MKRKIEITAVQHTRITIGRCPYCHREVPIDLDRPKIFDSGAELLHLIDQKEQVLTVKNEPGEK